MNSFQCLEGQREVLISAVDTESVILVNGIWRGPMSICAQKRCIRTMADAKRYGARTAACRVKGIRAGEGLELVGGCGL